MINDKLSLVPNKPGCYLMKNDLNVIIYVGKAKNLKKRLSSYFRGHHSGKTGKLVSEIVDFEYMVVGSETEAFILEINLIKKYSPKYNIIFRDDKSYPYIEFTMENVPKLQIVRRLSRKKNKNVRLYGPYPNVTAAKETVNLLNRMYPLRKCTSYNKRPCLYYHIGQCLGYCTNKVDEETIKKMEEEIVAFLNGDHSIITNKIKQEMCNLSENMYYEKALELKELLNYIETTLAKQHVEINDNVDRDVFGYYVDKGYLSVQVFFIRGAKIIGRHSKIFPLIDDVREELTRYIGRFYEKDILLPKEILVPSIVDNELLENYLKIKILIPIKGDKKKVIDMACNNSKIALEEQFLLIEKDEEKTIIANDELRTILNLDRLERIEVFDNSNLFGNFNVSGMVVFIDGKPNKNEYRKFKISLDKNDDYGTMREVIYRRYFRVIKDNLSYPDLIIVDGGIGQINIAREVIKDFNLNIPVIGLKKDDKHATDSLLAFDPIKEIPIDKRSNLFYYLERIQDEVHNFTINYHKQLRSKGSLASLLDNIDGIGPKRRNELLKKYKTVTKLREVSIEELSKIIPNNIAVNLKEFLKNG